MDLAKSSQMADGPSASAGAGYITEKLYMILQLYLQNKGWNMEMLQCISELKDSPVLPSAAYLQVLANRVALDSQGRLVLRDSGKIVLPFEHFANAVMLKHIGQTSPHGLHLTLEQTMRAVIDSYTIGRENFGMEKEFIIEVVTSCPSPACRYYKNHMSVPFIDQNFPSHLQQFSAPDIANSQNPNLTTSQLKQMTAKQQSQVQQQQQQLTAAIIQQQNRLVAQQSLEKFGNLSNLEKQRVLQQLDKKYLEAAQQQQQHHQPSSHTPQPIPPQATSSTSSTNGLNLHAGATSSMTQQPQTYAAQPSTPKVMPQLDPTSKISEYLRNMDSIDSISALHNGGWNNGSVSADMTSANGGSGGMVVGQDKIILAFNELMRNMNRMKQYIRPSMCKPYGKHSDGLQKALHDTLTLVQSLRSCLPASHIPVSSWKTEDRQQVRKDSENGNW